MYEEKADLKDTPEQAPVVRTVGEDGPLPTTTPAHSDEDPTDVDDESPDDDKLQEATSPVLSPMSILSEQSAPATIQPPRKLEKVHSDDAPTCGQSAGVLCGCI